jgi:hypothetical protein
MNAQEEIDKFQQKFYGYQNVISQYSKSGEEVINKIIEKSEGFNKLNDDQRIQIINTDPDFQKLSILISRLQEVYSSFYNFINQDQIFKSDEQAQKPQVQKPQEVQAPEGYYDED